MIEILSLSNLDPIFVDEAARGFGILAEGKGKGKEKGTHLSTKVSSHVSNNLRSSEIGWVLIVIALVCPETMELRSTEASRG